MDKLKNKLYHFISMETPEYLEKKLEDNRSFTAVMYILGGMIGVCLRIWDYVIDPVGAQTTGWLRSCFLFILIGTFNFKYIRNRWILFFTFPVMIFTGEILLLLILNRLETGMIFGISGFMLIMFMPIMLLRGFSLRINFMGTIYSAGVPHLLVLSGLFHGFMHSHYAVIIWPTATMIMIVQLIFSQKDIHNYNAERALEIASNTDPMTGVSNRRHFMELLSKELIRNDRFDNSTSFLMMDIDHFKKINDTYGHPTGDVAICTVVEIFQKNIRQSDIVARLGGEEFAILLPETDISSAVIIAERIRRKLENTVIKSLCETDFTITISIGAAEQPRGDLSGETLIRLSDNALYTAKSTGRNRVACNMGK
jgi:diguanylate cyclase (GGDEF)-like protein